MMTTTVHARRTEKRTNFLTRPPNFCQRLVRKEQLTAIANLSMLADRLMGGRTMSTSTFAPRRNIYRRHIGRQLPRLFALRASPTAKEISRCIPHCQVPDLRPEC
ncbi:hypothetical protein L798_15185 [Zootermopsis nevadensis]|uniref:Uncharacterized protein n=1 Tax=Zootermopsis nevadensis TaxID=136037 RepID=A0A067RTF6_ZOONE|nr:hypothetical protein L798_15185 [Zootermopsis nevadensis]